MVALIVTWGWFLIFVCCLAKTIVTNPTKLLTFGLLLYRFCLTFGCCSLELTSKMGEMERLKNMLKVRDHLQEMPHIYCLIRWMNFMLPIFCVHSRLRSSGKLARTADLFTVKTAKNMRQSSWRCSHGKELAKSCILVSFMYILRYRGPSWCTAVVKLKFDFL